MICRGNSSGYVICHGNSSVFDMLWKLFSFGSVLKAILVRLDCLGNYSWEYIVTVQICCEQKGQLYMLAFSFILIQVLTTVSVLIYKC